LSKATNTERSEEGPDRGYIGIFCAAFDSCLGANGTRAGCCSRADSRGRAFDFGATRARARRAIATLGLYVRAGINNNGLLLGNGALQHILRHIGNGRALGLQHVVSEIRHRRAGRNTGLQHVLRHIRVGNVLVSLCVTRKGDISHEDSKQKGYSKGMYL
jgi:hypothetical protein